MRILAMYWLVVVAVAVCSATIMGVIGLFSVHGAFVGFAVLGWAALFIWITWRAIERVVSER